MGDVGRNEEDKDGTKEEGGVGRKYEGGKDDEGEVDDEGDGFILSDSFGVEVEEIELVSELSNTTEECSSCIINIVHLLLNVFDFEVF